jgi:hypothetical protein
VVLEVRAPCPFAVLFQPVVLEERVFSPFAVLLEIFPPPRPTVILFTVASAVVTRLPLAVVSRNASILFLRNTTSVLSVVPRKFVDALVPALPRRDHHDAAIAHLAFPVASEVRT